MPELSVVSGSSGDSTLVARGPGGGEFLYRQVAHLMRPDGSSRPIPIHRVLYAALEAADSEPEVTRELPA